MTWDPASEITVDPERPLPLYAQVAEQLRAAIDNGLLPTGTRLDNEIELAARLGLSRPTMRQAIQELVSQGLLVRKRGVGTQVVRTKVTRPLRLSSLFDDLSGLGQTPGTTVLANQVEPAKPGVAELLEAKLKAVLRLSRVRTTDGEPIALMNNYLPAGIIDPSDEELEERGLYRLLRSAGVRLHSAQQTIGARVADATDAELLDETLGAPLLTMTRTTYDESGRVVEYGWHVYRASRYSFNLSLSNVP
jgi:DNA-binding GntR family transcriptional regulator